MQKVTKPVEAIVACQPTRRTVSTGGGGQSCRGNQSFAVSPVSPMPDFTSPIASTKLPTSLACCLRR